MWLKWLPWRFALRRVARASGFLDPIELLTRLHSLAQPSEVGEPIELLRAGVVFHARGLINSRVLQHNRDWVWPYWVERQYDPRDPSFLPRAFSVTHINLSHRNWTAVGIPDCAALPIVDPRGLVTPLFDGWSLDAWIVTDDGRELLPSRADVAEQRLELDPHPVVVTSVGTDGLRLVGRVDAIAVDDAATLRLDLDAGADADAWLVLSLRPCNPEGISFVHEIGLSADRTRWRVEGRDIVAFDTAADRHHVSNYRNGDVHIHLHDRADERDGTCEVGLLTAAALFRLRRGEGRQVTVRTDLNEAAAPGGWADDLGEHCRLQLPDAHAQWLYDVALRTLVLHAPDDVYPGPYTYKRFWFRDAAFILHGLLCAGLVQRTERVLDRFPRRQRRDGFFRSQDGEWDSNGEALWIMHRYCALTGRIPKPAWQRAIRRAGRWLHRKRLPDRPATPHAGLLPAGFSAEHLGPNDYYYWDDFWAAAGLRAGADLCRLIGDAATSGLFEQAADGYMAAIDRSLDVVAARIGRAVAPASPYRRLDSGAVGSIVASYPLQLWAPRDPRLFATVEYLLADCLIDGGFYQDMVHSGINAYLTLHLAQVLLRAGDPRWFELAASVARFASPTGQWPEAIHPRTGGGCMGDGQHVWAAAEWVMLLRNCFVREEQGRLVLASGLVPAWLPPNASASFGPAPTPFGDISIDVERSSQRITVSWLGAWRAAPPPIEVRLPGHPPVRCEKGEQRVVLEPEPVR
jgi:hypothetical protein